MEKTRRTIWSDAELALFRRIYADLPNREVASRVGRSVKAVSTKAANLRLRKSLEYKHRLGVIRASNPSAVSTRFRPGHVPPNKGKSIWQFMSREGIERSKATRFKPGHRPRNTKPEGYECMIRGYVFVKVGGRMRKKHIVEWEKINGRMPEGMMVVFADGNRQNFSPDNLVLMTRSEAMRRIAEERSPEEQKTITDKIHAARNESIRKDKMRIRWGLEPRTKLVKKWYPREARV